MLGPRYVLLGLAPVRAAWFRTLAQWAQASSIPVEFGKCVSAEELRARLSSNRSFSAVLIDADLPSLDRDLIGAARQVGCPVLVVEDQPSRRQWSSLGVSATLSVPFDQAELMDLLRRHTRPVPDSMANDVAKIDPISPDERGLPKRRAIVVTVVGSGGVGTSTVAMALAQGLARPPNPERPPTRLRPLSPLVPARMGKERISGLSLDGGVVLVDMDRRGDLAVLHDVRDVVPGLQELVAAHRNGDLTPRQVAALTFDIEQRGYHLLLGLRRACDWASIQPRCFSAALDSLRGAYGALVCDIEPDFEGEREGGSIDVEERNVMSRSALLHSDVVLAVGLGGVKGTHSLLRLLRELYAAGAPPARIVPVCNRAPRSQRAKAEMARALGELGGVADRAATSMGVVASPIFLPERALDEMAGHAALLPATFVGPLVAVVSAVLGRVGWRTTASEQSGPTPLRPGSLGHFQSGDETALG